MSKSVVFPYGITLREGGKIDIFPAAEVGFLSKEGEWLTLFLVIDSGATISALPKSDAPAFGVEIENGIPMTISGISGELIPGWQHQILVRLGDTKIKLPVAFLDNDLAPRVLGRAGIFERFMVLLEEKRRRTAFLGERTRSARSISKTLDMIQ